jgi:hypothetical protein
MALRSLAFGDAEIGIWGSAWDLGRDDPAFTATGARGSAAVLDRPARIEPADDEKGTWWLASDELELESVPEGEPGTYPDGFDQLVRVRGRLRAGGAQQEIDCLGTRVSRRSIELTQLESIRGVSAWFGPELGLAVLAARPRGATGHDHDLLSASLFEGGRSETIEDPRLSTTYAQDGTPARASVELWQAPDEAETSDGGQEPPEARPRRAAGESIGSAASGPAGQLDVQAGLFRWHAEGREGPGVYVLARTR